MKRGFIGDFGVCGTGLTGPIPTHHGHDAGDAPRLKATQLTVRGQARQPCVCCMDDCCGRDRCALHAMNEASVSFSCKTGAIAA